MGAGRFSEPWRQWRASVDLDEYETRWDRLAAAGEAVHGEADLVMRYAPRSVLDAGCGMGRVAIELAARGVDVVGVDLDADLLARARRRAPQLVWVEDDLSRLDLDRRFDVVVMAGNVLPFADEPVRAAVVAACARHLERGGLLITGAGLRDDWPTLAAFDGWCADSGLELVGRLGGWTGEAFGEPAAYAVSIHRHPGATAVPTVER